MPADYTTTRLISQVRMRGMIPRGDNTFSDQNLVDLANEALQSYVVPKLLQVNEGYFVKPQDVEVSAGIDTYPLPARSIAGRVRDVQLVETSGSVISYVPLERLEEERLYWAAGTGSPNGYVIRGNSIILAPLPDADYTIRILYYRRPGELILESDADELTSVTDNGTYYVTNVTYAAGYYDIVKSSGLFDWAVFNVQAANVGGSLAFLKTACEGLPEVGDFVCATGLSPIPQIPAELRVLLFERTKFECLNAIGDPKSPGVEAACDRRWTSLSHSLTNRGEGKARVIINPHGPGMRRFSGIRRLT